MALAVTLTRFRRSRGLPLDCLTALVLLAAIARPITAAPQQQSGGNDIPKTFNAPLAGADYVRREAMIRMRDGVKLYTVVVVPKGARNAHILL